MVLLEAYGVGFTLPHGIEGKAFRERKSSTCPIIHCGGCSISGPTHEGPVITFKVACVSLDFNGGAICILFGINRN